MSDGGRRGVGIVFVGLALGLGVLAVAAHTRPLSLPFQLPPPLGAFSEAEAGPAHADGLRVRLDQALVARARALEPAAVAAGRLPELVAAIDLGADAATFEDLLETEDWWAETRAKFEVSAVIPPKGGAIAIGPSMGELAGSPLVKQAREIGQASAVVSAHGRVFLAAAARAGRGRRAGAGGTIIVLGALVDQRRFEELAEGLGASVGLSDGKHLAAMVGAEADRAPLAAMVGKEARGPVPAGDGRTGVAWALGEGGPWALTLAAATVAPHSAGLLAYLLLAVAVVFGIAGLPLLLSSRRAWQPGAAAAGASGPGAMAASVGTNSGMSFDSGGALPVDRRSSAEIPAVGAIPGDAERIGAHPTTLAPESGVISSGNAAAAAAAAGVPAAMHAEAEPAAPSDGLTVGRYRLIERLGEGGMAEVMIAETHGAEGFVRRFVVKRMHAHLARNRNAVNQFIDEARLQAGLVHSNIVPVYDFGKAGGEYYMALEYIHGRDLEQLVRRHVEVFGCSLSVDIAFYVMHEVLEALAYAHTKTDAEGRDMQIVHRDVAPGNVLVSARGEVKLSDFGIAKAGWRMSRTDVGLVKGNANFMSPEQARGEPVDARTDLFAVGMVLYYCLTAQLLYGEDHAVINRLMRAAIGPATAELLAQIGQVPAEAVKILRRAVSQEPHARFQTALEFARELSPHLVAGRAELSDLMMRLFPDLRREPG